MRDFTFSTFSTSTSSPIVFQLILYFLVKFGEELIQLMTFLTTITFCVTSRSCVTSRWLTLLFNQNHKLSRRLKPWQLCPRQPIRKTMNAQ